MEPGKEVFDTGVSPSGQITHKFRYYGGVPDGTWIICDDAGSRVVELDFKAGFCTRVRVDWNRKPVAVGVP
jgi:hypothetical protein